jgi:hypothetical protein
VGDISDTFDSIFESFFAEDTRFHITKAFRAFIGGMPSGAFCTASCLTTPFTKMAHPQALEALRGSRFESVGSVEVIIQKDTRFFNAESQVLISKG